MTLIELLKAYSFHDIKESFLDLYPDEEDEMDKYEHVYHLFREDEAEISFDISTYALSFSHYEDGTPYLYITPPHGEGSALNLFDWLESKHAVITDDMMIECSPERIAAITLYDFGYETIYWIFYDDL